MKKLKKFWQENSVLLVLLLILVACVVAITIVVFTYFVGTNSSKYGDRLEGIEDHPFTDKVSKSIKSSLEEDEKIEKVSLETKGKRIIITMKFVAGTTLVEAQSKALASLELFDEDTQDFYDLEYQIEAEATENADGFILTGSHNVGGTGGIVWVQNNITEEE